LELAFEVAEALKRERQGSSTGRSPGAGTGSASRLAAVS
jgi:hypothetical protein